MANELLEHGRTVLERRRRRARSATSEPRSRSWSSSAKECRAQVGVLGEEGALVDLVVELRLVERATTLVEVAVDDDALDVGDRARVCARGGARSRTPRSGCAGRGAAREVVRRVDAVQEHGVQQQLSLGAERWLVAEVRMHASKRLTFVVGAEQHQLVAPASSALLVVDEELVEERVDVARRPRCRTRGTGSQGSRPPSASSGAERPLGAVIRGRSRASVSPRRHSQTSVTNAK